MYQQMEKTIMKFDMKHVNSDLIQLVVEHAPCSVLVTDAEGSILYVNEAFSAITGYDQSEILGENPRILKSGLHSDLFYRDMWNCLVTKGRWSGNLTNRRKNGDLYSEYALILAVKDISGDITNFIALKENITQLGLTKNALNRQREEYNHLADQMVNAFAVFQVEFNNGVIEQSQLKECNPAFEIMVGLSKDELIGQELVAVMPDMETIWLSIVSSVLQGQTMYFDECQLGDDDSYYNLTAYLASSNRIALVFNNVTFYKQAQDELLHKNSTLDELNRKLKHNQQQLVQSEKMASIGQLAAGVAHEINNPIGFVASNITTLVEYVGTFNHLLDAYEKLVDLVATDTNSELKTVIDDIQRIKEEEDLAFIRDDIMMLLKESAEGTSRVSDIVRNLKSFARADRTDVAEADLNVVLENTLKIVWNELKYKCEVVREFSEIPPVVCHVGEIGQVFLNLLVNAGQAITSQGTITVHTEALQNGVKVVISDTGCGISEQHLGRIFDPFYTTKDVGKGTGLGLSISHGIIEKHGGTIHAKSVVGEGTSFIIFLPVSSGVEAADMP